MLRTKACEINKRIEELKRELIGLINGLPDSPGITKLGNNCCTVSLSLLSQHDNWSAGYWLSAELKDVLTGKIQRLAGDKLDAFMENLIQTGAYEHGGYMLKIHPDIAQRIKEIWNGTGTDINNQ